MAGFHPQALVVEFPVLGALVEVGVGYRNRQARVGSGWGKVCNLVVELLWNMLNGPGSLETQTGEQPRAVLDQVSGLEHPACFPLTPGKARSKAQVCLDFTEHSDMPAHRSRWSGRHWQSWQVCPNMRGLGYLNLSFSLCSRHRQTWEALDSSLSSCGARGPSEEDSHDIGRAGCHAGA